MKIVYIFILTLIRFCLSCKESGKIIFLPPFNDAEEIQAKVDDDINIVCCHSDGAGFLEWEDKNGNVISYKNSGGIFSLKDEKDRLILRIDNFNEMKSGKYTCKNSKKYLTKSINISVKNSPSIPVFHKVTKYFPKNKAKKFECPLKEKQVFTSWSYTEGNINRNVNKPGKGKNFEVSEDKLTFIIINNENTESIKALWCHFQDLVSNQLQSGSYEFTWILYDPIDVKIDLENKGPILEGHDVTMICTFNYIVTQAANFPINNVKPTFIIKSPYNGRIDVTIPKITKDLDGEYECRVTNFLINADQVEETAKMRINVLVPPKIVQKDMMNVTVKIDENAHLKCVIVGNNLNENDVYFERQSLNSSWIKLNSDNEGKYKIGFVRNQDNSILTLTINNVQWEDRGVYQCFALNAAGKATFPGKLKVRKTPTLHTKSENIVMAIMPVEVDCSVSGFPIYNNNDDVQLRVINESSPFYVKKVNSVFNDMEELRAFFKVSYQRKFTEGVNYTLECFYYSETSKINIKKFINLQIASRPDPPKVSIICSGSNGIVFQYEIQKKTQTTKDVIKNELFYAPSFEFDNLNRKPSKIIPIIENEYIKKNLTYVLKNLMPSTNYSFKWDSYNIFQIENSVHLMSKTKNLSPPQKPTSLKFSTGDGVINVDVNWEDDCPYSGANEAIKDVIVRMKLLGSGNIVDKNRWEWAVTNFTLDVENKLLQFPITLDRPQVNYEIEVVLRGAQGVSQPIVAVYTAETVLAGSLFSCFPRCLSQNLSSNVLLVYSALMIYLSVLHAML